jgi:two-component system sensor histidine kinase BaeS
VALAALLARAVVLVPGPTFAIDLGLHRLLVWTGLQLILISLGVADAGELKLQREPMDPAALAADAVGAFSASAAERGVALRDETESRLGLVDADPTRIRQVLANLISNSLRYTPRGGEIVVSVVRAADGGIRMAVRDTGSGIRAEELPRVFDRFHHSAESKGSGLGLAIARNLVEAHGGVIEAHSDGAGRGTEVSFSLPA